MKQPIINTPRALLTLLQPDQVELLQLYQQENTAHLAPWEPLREAQFFSREATCERILQAQENFRLGISVNFAVLTPDAGKMIAACNFNNIVRGIFQACYMGYSIGQPYQGQGLMYEAAQAGIAYMFDTIGLHRIMANHMPSNRRSENLLARLGFEREGYAKAYLKIGGSWQDHVLNALINSANN